MLTASLFVLLLAITAWLIYRASALIKLAITDWKSWHNSLPSQIIGAEDRILIDIQPEWPLKEIRWPSPVGIESDHMSAVRCRAYARAAASRAKSLRFQAEAWVLLGAALMGWRIPIFFTQILTPDSGLSHARPVDILEISILQISPMIAVILIAAFGLLLRQLSDDYETALRYYEQTAEATINKKKLMPLISRPTIPIWKTTLTILLGHEPKFM